jgi:hypothetical protein
MHAAAGVLFLLVFLGTGFYMHARFPGAYREDPAIRMMFRSTHIYILFSALINILLGAHSMPPPIRWRRALQTAGSAFLLASPFLFTAAFFIEPQRRDLGRTLTLPGVVLSLAGVLFHAIASLRKRSPHGAG